MSDNRQNYHNLLENKNHLTVASRAHNTIESLENQAQDAFSVERTPPQFFMQRMGQLQIFSYGRGRYNLNQKDLKQILNNKKVLLSYLQKRKKLLYRFPPFSGFMQIPKN